ncbi:ABC transporter permease subunit [Fictibacillus iocasae]|uniref:ABC transporter permease subunit n=1 Tax=Fictibacillus iocasae TaxID=2715437 RepID=A0ABW2NVZ5_9BACL
MFFHEWRSIRKSTAIWSAALVAVTILFLSMFPSISRDAEAFQRLLSGYPKEVLQAFGLQLEMITSFLGFYSYMFTYVMLIGAIQAMNLGAGIVAKEVSGKTSEFLLSKPVSRFDILRAKWRAVVLSIAVTNMVFVSAAYLMALAVAEKLDVKVFLLMSLSNVFVQLFFAVLGFFLAVSMNRIKSVLTLSLSTVMAFFLLSMIGSVLGEDAVRYVTPFQYFDFVYVIQHASYEWGYLVVEAVFFCTMLVASFYVFSKKDVHSV